jgi:hypothetical protein
MLRTAQQRIIKKRYPRPNNKGIVIEQGIGRGTFLIILCALALIPGRLIKR